MTPIRFKRTATLLTSVSLALFLAFAPGNISLSHAQVSGKAFQGFSSNNKSPIQIDADELEVLDESNKAIYRGRVKILQGSSVVTTDQLTVHYGKKKGGNDNNNIDQLNFDGNLVVTSGANTATADNGIYWVNTDDVELTGNVVVSQGANAAKGCKLTANLKTNVAKIHSCGGRVSTIITPKK